MSSWRRHCSKPQRRKKPRASYTHKATIRMSICLYLGPASEVSLSLNTVIKLWNAQWINPWIRQSPQNPISLARQQVRCISHLLGNSIQTSIGVIKDCRKLSEATCNMKLMRTGKRNRSGSLELTGFRHLENEVLLFDNDNWFCITQKPELSLVFLMLFSG